MKKMTLQDISFINDFYLTSNSELGYNSFTGTYAMCLAYHQDLYYEVINDDMFTYIIVDHEAKETCITPISLGTEPEKNIVALKEFCIKNTITMGKYIDKQFVRYLNTWCAMKQAEDIDHEVLYPIARFQKFEGIDSQKRRANIFLRNNKYKIREYTGEHNDQILKLAEYREENSDHPTKSCDTAITKFFIDNHEILPI